MGAEMRLLRFTKLLLLALPLIAFATVHATDSEDASSIKTEGIRPARIERDLDGVTTVLLVPARPGKSNPPVGLLTKTARTFVQDGASTEYATQVLGTTLDNGRLYARILSTSSRIFYDRESSPDPSSAYLVYPSRSSHEDLQLKVSLENAPISVIERFETSASQSVSEGKTEEKNNLSENDVLGRHDLTDDSQIFKPAKVRPADDLPTYTVKQEYVSRIASEDDDQQKNFRPRAPKIFKSPPKVSAKKPDLKSLSTVTYHGFADFTTTVGDTVIVFSPSTAPAPIGRPATSIKGDATLRPDDGIAVLKIRPTNVLGQRKTELTQNRNRPQGFPPRNLGAKSNEDIFNLQPSVVNDPDSGHVEPTSPLLLDFQTNSLKPTGLIKVIDSTTSLDGTTTHYKSSIYGTYVGTNYAQIVHTSSNVYYFPDESSVSFDESTTHYATTESETEEYASTTEDGLTTLVQETTENVPTTPRFRLRGSARLRPKLRPAKPVTTTPVSTDDDTANAIVPLDPQGRSIKHGAQRNQLNQGNNQTSKSTSDKVSLATRLLPSTIYKTFTYFTTFFIPGKNDQTTTSVKTREAVSSEVTYLTELIQPTATQGGSTSSATFAVTEKKILESSSIQKQEDQEIELIFKTLYTTYTYLTTFFQESTSSVSSREVVETNVITQTLGPNGASVDISGLFDDSESIFIAPTRVAGEALSTKEVKLKNRITTENPIFPTTDSEDTLTTLMDESTTPNDILSKLEPSEVSPTSTKSYEEVEKTYYTTYTYFTTIFVEDETEIETRTEVFTNVVTEKIQPTTVQVAPSSSKPSNEKAPPPEIVAYLEALKRQKSQEEALKIAKKSQDDALKVEELAKKDETKVKKSDEENNVTTENTIDYLTTEGVTDLDTDIPTTFESTTTEQMHVKPNSPVDGEVLGSMITDVVSSSSSGGGTFLDVAERRNIVPEDQELSESNHHEVEPVPTLLLQTSYTTFTYFTTMYKGDESNVVSRLETVTNVVTETIKPTAVFPAESSTLPVTYFTTFTYWTTFYKGGDTITTSREETVSNVVEPGVSPTPTIALGSVMTYRPDISDSPAYQNVDNEKVTADNEVGSFVPVFPEKTSKLNLDDKWNGIKTDRDSASTVEPLATSVALDPTTFYTTYTYFTTSYVGDSTVLNSRLETVTSVYYPEDAANVATGRAIGGAIPTVQVLGTNEKALNEIAPTKASGVSKTGLISTIRSSHVADGTTTHYLTDVYGTYIDGLYAQVEQSSTKLEIANSATATPVLPTGVLSLNKGSIVDADKVSTVFFTTKQIGTLIDGLYAKVIESTSSTKIDEAKLATHSPVHGHRTGLVRLIQGNIVANGTSVFYESKVIGTSIEGRYAQIIESTSSYLTSPTKSHNLAPTATLKPNHATGSSDISPSPAVIQSSLSEDPTSNNEDDDQEGEEEGEDGEDDEEDEDGQKNTKKSRLTFSSRKRTFTPVIRPFASRNRPTFNPKRKNAQGATTITRTDVTPTVTATLAGKGNRYASSRVRVTSPIGPYSSTLSPSNSRRFAGRRVSPTSTFSSSGAPAGSTRGRAQSRITPSSSFSVNRRGPSSIRGSSARPASRTGSSSVFPGASSRYRPGIRPSSLLAKVTPTVRQDDQEDNANEFTATTLVTEETPYTIVDEDLTTLQTTTESSRRSTNPLLRFRSRPLLGNVSPRGTTTPRSTTPVPPRRPNNLTRQNGVVSRARPNVRPTTPLPPTRPRQGQTGLFPPRGLFGKKPEPTEGVTESINEGSEGEHPPHLEDVPVEEIADNDYEGSEHEETAPARNSSRTGKAFKQSVQIRPFGYGRRRVRRQASQLRSYSNRARRPTSQPSGYLEDRLDSDVASSDEDFSKSNSKYNTKYASRGRSLNAPRPSSVTGKKAVGNVDNSESSEVNNLRSRTKPTSNRGTSPRVKPSPASGLSRQFTLREKDTGTTRASYKRPTTPGTRRVDTRPRTSSRLRGSSRDTSRRLSSSRSSSRNSGRSSNRRLPSRSRGGPHEDFREAGFVYPETDGTITVTHYVPVEVTVPYVTNGITEKRNIITAQPSTQVLSPESYNTVLSGDGNPLVVINSQNTGTNAQGQVEVTRFLLHEKPTTRVSYTLTTLGGRRASQSVIIPSTIYSVENIVSTVQPSLPGANSPLANILLSQLLLGQLGQQNALLGGMTTPATPTTRFDTRTTTYVTTITKLQSTIIPLTFRGKEILTTIVESSSNVVTATEFITDTVVVTPTAAIPQANLNSLLYLLQQPQNPLQPNPLLDPLFAAAPASQSNTLPGEVERRNQPVDADYKSENYDDSSEEETESKSRRYKGSSKSGKKDTVAPAAPESSVVTLYVSGRRPGEFSTVLSTVKIGEETTTPRRRRDIEMPVQPSAPPTLRGVSESEGYILSGSEEPADPHAPTQSLESVVGDYQYELDDREKYNRYQENNFAQDRKFPNDPTNSFGERVQDSDDDYEKLTDERQRKRVRIRVPVVRSRNGKQFARTVVRRRPVVPYTKSVTPPEVNSHSPRRIVVTRVRPRGPAHSSSYANELITNVDYQSYENARQNLEFGTHRDYHPSDLDDPQFSDLEKRKEFQSSEFGRHKVTITRRRKILPTTTSTFQRERVTRKKLVSVRPIPQPSPTLAIITTGFFTLPSEDDEDEEYSDEEEEENPIDGNRNLYTPTLHETPNTIENKPPNNKDLPDVSKIEDLNKPIIITDNFFFPIMQDDDDGYDDDDSGAKDDDLKVKTNTPDKDVQDDYKTDNSKKLDDDNTKDRNDTRGNDNVEVEDDSFFQSGNKEIADAEENYTSTPKFDSKDNDDEEADHVNDDSKKLGGVTTDETSTSDKFTTKLDDVTTETPLTDEDVYQTTKESPLEAVTETSVKDIMQEVRTESSQKDDSKSSESTTTPVTPLETTESTTTEQLNLPEVTDQPETPINESFSPTPKLIPDSSSIESTTPKSTEIPIKEDSLTVKPLETFVQQEHASSVDLSPQTESGYFTDFDDADIPSVIPLDTEYILESSQTIITSQEKSRPIAHVTTMFTSSPTPEDIEAGLADDLYLSLSRPDFPEILPSKPLFDSVVPTSDHSGSVIPTPALKTSVYYTETIVTSTRLRTYTYVVTKLNGLETEVTSSTTVRPRVTTLTLTVPITVTVTPTAALTSSLAPSDNNPEIVTEYTGKDDDDDGSEGEGRKFNLATRVMSNGVEVIVAGPTPALRWENSNPQPTLTLSDAVVMLLPQEKPNEFVTKTCTTTFTYLSTITKDGVKIVSTDQQVVANTATEERHRKPASEAAVYTLEASPTLQTEVFKTTYTYLTLNTDHPDEKNALESSVSVITNTVTAPKYYLDMILEPSEAPRPETNTYLSTRVLEKTITEDGRTRIESTSDTVTQLIITESAPPPRPISVETTLTALDENESLSPDITKTYYITYTYYNTFLEKDSTVIKTNVATSTDYVLEKAPKKTSIKNVPANQTPDPIQIYATKTYLTTFTYFTTLLQAGLDGKTATTISSRSHIVENVVTESIAPSLLEAGYMSALLTTSQHSDSVNNVVTGSTIIFFDDEEQTQPTSTTLQDTLATASHENVVQVPESSEILSSNVHSNSESEDSVSIPEEQESSIQEEIVPPESVEDPVQNKRPTVLNSDLQVSNLLNLGSLGINSLSALGPVITAMAGLLQGKTANRRNDTSPIPPNVVPVSEAPDTTTLRSPIYIPVADFADGDIETAESQNVAHLINVNHNHIPETRHKVTASLADGIPISPGEVITANSDVIIGKPGKMGPRPPEKFLKDDEHIGMKPPPMSVPNISVHPVLEVVEDNRENFKHKEISHIGNIPLEIIPAHQIYEEHIKVPVRYPFNPQKRPHPLQPLLPPPKRISSKHDILENDPLLRPPDRPIVEKYPQQSENDNPKYPWNPKEPLTPPLPTSINKMQTDYSLKTKPWIEEHQSWPQDKLNLKPSEFSQTPESNPSLTEPIVHQVPHVIDRGTGQPLLVNLQPSQVANVVIPQGGTQALIFGDTNEPHISGQYFDDPSPYPESEVRPIFTSISKVENIQYPTDETNYMIPPSPPKTYKPAVKPGNSKRPHVIPLSQTHAHQEYIKPHGTSILRPVERYPVRRPEVPGTPAGQGHVHTEILVHHKPETINLRPQPVSHRPHPFPIQQLPPRRDFNKLKKPIENTPPRRTEVSLSTEKPQEFGPSVTLDSGNEVTGNKNWKLNQKPQRTSLTRRPRPTFKPRYPTRGTIHTNNRPVIKKPSFITNQRLPLKPPTDVDQSNTFAVNNQKLNTSIENQKIDFPYNIASNVKQSMSGDISPVSQQNTVPNFFSNGEKLPATNSQTERTDEYIPTGAVEYKNPSSEQQIKNTGNQYYAPTSMVAEESGKPVPDSESADSDPVKFETHPEYDKEQSETSGDSTNTDKQTNQNQNVFNSEEVNEKPGDSNSHVVFQYPMNNGHDLRNQYGVRPYGMPVIQGKPFGVYGVNNHDNRAPIYGNVQGSFSYQGSKVLGNDDTIDLKPPAIIPQFEPNGHSRPYGRPDAQPGIYQQPEIITKPPSKTSRPDQSDFVLFGEGHMQPGPGQVISVNAEPDWSINHNRSKIQSLGRPSLEKPIPKPTPTYIGISRPEIGSGVRIHPDYPHIITKPKIRVPGPITISSGSSKPVNSHKRPQFSLPIEAIGDEEDSKTQTERPPSSLVKKPKPNKEPIDETLETAFQTNFASTDSKEDSKDTPSDESQRKGMSTTTKPKIPSQNMMPPPRVPAGKPTDQVKKTDNQEGLKPPLKTTEVVGLSPPPVDITTTNRPADSKITTLNESGLRPPPLFIPLKESVSKAGTVSSPSNKMVPPSPRPTHIRPFLADILSEDMVPPPPAVKTSKPIEIATVKPIIAVDGSIQIASAIATSHVPVMQDVESKIPIIHGTVDLPVIIDVPEILKPVETKKVEHVSIYTARPFETKQAPKVSIQPSAILTTNLVMPTPTKSSVHIEASKAPATEPTATVIVSRKPSKRPDYPVFLEPSMENILPSTTKIESTETLSYPAKPEQKERRPTSIHRETVTKVRKPYRPHLTRHQMRNNTDNRVVYSIATKIESSVGKATPTISKPKDVPHFIKGESIEIVKEIIGTVEEHEVMQNRSTSNQEMKPKEFTKFKTLTITRTQTSVLGSPPTTRTLLLTHTMTSTSVETITETLISPTNVISTITSTILQSIPASYENEASDDSIDSIFVVMSDQKPPEPGAEEVEAEYGEEISRDEQDPAGNEIHRVLAGGILGAPVIPLHPVINQCVPECRAFKAEMCAEFSGEMRCVCRPGFARMFPDRPCKPTYTYTLRVGLDRIGRDNVIYTDKMNDTSSSEYRRLAPNVKEALDRTLMQSDLRDLYQGVKIASFVPEPVQVKFHVYLFDNANGTHLKEILRKYLVNSNYSLGGTEVYASRNLSLVVAEDFDECTTIEDGWSHHDCSMNAVCFNLPGSYQCSCKEGWADLSENPAYPGRLCSQAPLGCSACNNKGHCVINSHGHNTCECFPWHSGQKCQINLKVLLIALVTTGAVLLGLLAVCVGLACFRHPGRRRSSGDRRAMIPGAGGDTSSEGSVAELAIPHHVPHVLPPPPQMLAPAPPIKRPIRKPSNRLRHHARKVMPVVPPIATINTEQRDRSLTVMIPRAKYRSAPQSNQPSHKPTIKSTFSVEEHKLIDYLEGGIHPGMRKQNLVVSNDCKEAEIRVKKSPISPTGALVSAGFQVSATVTRTVDAESTLARSCGETTVEPATKILRSNDFQGDLESSLARSCTETTIQTSANQLLRLDMVDTGSTLARSCGETTILPSTKIANSDRKDNRDARDSTSEGHTMAERDLGSTLRLPAQHVQLYNSDRANSDRESNFDSL